MPTLWGGRATELRPIFVELAALNDNALATVLNERGIPALGGGPWQGIKVTRLRQKFQMQRDKAAAEYEKILRKLIKDFGKRDLTRHDTDFLLLDHVAGLVFMVGNFNDIISRGGGDVSGLSLDQCEDYQRLAAQLSVALVTVQIASGGKFDRSRSDYWSQVAFNKEHADKIAARLKPSSLSSEARVGPYVTTLTTETACAGAA